MTILLSCENITKYVSNRTLFENLCLKMDDNERIGLIGPNGSGKSTLLKIMAGKVDSDNGEVSTRKGLQVVYLEQREDFDPDKTILELAMEMSKDDIEDIYMKEANASSLLTQIGFNDLTVKAGSLSGGWLKRLAIAGNLSRDADVYFLDEPTNHLDVDGIEWLEKYLKSFRKPYIIITHDRFFLEKATNRIIELNDIYDEGYLSYNCAYDEFLQRKEDFLDSEKARFLSMANKNRNEQEWVKAGVKARSTKQKARLDAAAELKQNVSKLRKQVADPISIQIEFDATDRKTKRLLVANHISKSYGDKIILDNFDLLLTPKVRIGLLGLNGMGKTTLIKMLCGEEEPDSGKVAVMTGINVLHFDQKHQIVDENQTLKEALSDGSDTIIYRDKPMHITAWAKKLKFRGDQLNSPVKVLSGGERARIIMGRLMLQKADILFLDEPTNDLDIESIEVLEESLMSFPGAIVLVTHDRAMLDRVSTIMLSLDGAGQTSTYASYSQWKKAQDPKEIAKKNKKAKEEQLKQEQELQQAQEKPAEKVKLSFKDQYEWDNLEENILKAEEILQTLNDNPIPHDSPNFTRYCDALAKAQENIDGLYERWTELEARQK